MKARDTSPEQHASAKLELNIKCIVDIVIEFAELSKKVLKNEEVPSRTKSARNTGKRERLPDTSKNPPPKKRKL